LRNCATVLTELRKSASSGFFLANTLITFVFCEIGSRTNRCGTSVVDDMVEFGY